MGVSADRSHLPVYFCVKKEEMNLRACVITSSFPPQIGGIATFADGLVQSLVHSAEEISVLLIVVQGNERVIEQVSPTYTRIMVPKRGPLQTCLAVTREVMRHRAQLDVLHSLNVFPFGFFLTLIGKIISLPVVVSFYGSDVLSQEGR